MGFAINPSMNYLDVPEKYIQEIHQSSSEVVLPDARFRGHPCEAYICITKFEKEMKAYVALLNNALKSTLVYTSDFVASTPQDYPRVFQEAEEFVKSMGFTMQKVNLEFSAAMREVIIKGLRVMRPPAPQKRPTVRPLIIDVPEKLVVATGLNEAQPAEAAPAADTNAMAELLSLKAELASARSALERVTREKIAAEQKSSSEKGALKASCEQAMESRRLAEERLAQAVRELKKLQQTQPPQADSGELLRLREQLEQAASANVAAEQAREKLQDALKGERERVTRLEGEKDLLEKRLAAGTEKISALQVEAAATKQTLEDQLAAARAAGAEATEKMAAMAGFERSWREALQREEELRRQGEAVGADLSTARRELEELRERIAITEEELASARKESKELSASGSSKDETQERLAEAEAELVAFRERLAALSAENERLVQTQGQSDEIQHRLATTETELTKARQEIAELLASRDRAVDMERIIADTTAELAVAREKLVAADAEIAQLTSEQGHIGELRQQLAIAEADLSRARSEVQRREEIPAAVMAAVDLPTEEQITRIAEEKATVEAEYVRLATESRESEALLAESLSLAEAEVERLTNELEIQSQVAAMEQAALRAELRRLIVGGGAAHYPPAAPAESAATMAANPLPQASQLAPSPHPAAPPPEPTPVEQPTEMEEEDDDTPDAPIAGDAAILQEFTSDFGGFYGGGGMSTTEFRIDPSLDTISYTDPGEVIALFYSSNSVQAVPDGKGIQRCKGYIVATKTLESYRVYVAWYLTESGRVVVCLPEEQPSDSEECIQILKDAVSYFEIVGFMMEVAELGSTRRSYREKLKKIPVLKKAPTPQ